MREFLLKLEEDAELELDLNGEVVLIANAEGYTGDYEVTPKTTAQELETAQKLMMDNVTVNAIPYYEVSNSQNGKTVIIGG